LPSRGALTTIVSDEKIKTAVAVSTTIVEQANRSSNVSLNFESLLTVSLECATCFTLLFFVPFSTYGKNGLRGENDRENRAEERAGALQRGQHHSGGDDR